MRFHTLDGMRGVAAIMVLFFHLGSDAPIAAPLGYLAVDLFFGLSGFVISHAYAARLRDGLAWREFALLRLIRIYPMAFLGAAISVVLFRDYALSLLLIPDLGGNGGTGPLFPINGPMWSLVLELLVNLAFAAVAVRLNWRWLLLIMAGSAIVLAIGIGRYHLGGLGAFWPGIGYGLARTLFSFTVGLAMHRVHVEFRIRRRTTRLAWLLPAALAAFLMKGDGVVSDLSAVFVLLPILVWLGTVWEAPNTRWFDHLGGMSYPLYCIHGTIIHAIDLLDGPRTYAWLPLLVAAWWLNRNIDVPLRRILMQALDRRPAVQPQAL